MHGYIHAPSTDTFLDCIKTRLRDQNNILNTRAMRSTDFATGHVMLQSKITFVLKKASSKTKRKARPKLNGEKLRSKETCKKFQKLIDNIADYEDMVMNLKERCDKLKRYAYSTAMKTLRKPDRKHQEWFNKNDA